MRNLFLALVLANLAFAAWHNWFAETTPGGGTSNADVPGITLVSELGREAQNAGDAANAAPNAGPQASGGAPATDGQAAQTAPEGEATASAAPADDSRCVSVGPFRELSQAAAAASKMRMGGLDPSQRVAEGDIWVGYWVYIGGIPTQAQANDILSKLKAHDITDAYVIPDTDSGNLISLGVFSQVQRAGRRREDARALGYDVTVTDRTRRGTVYWVDVRLSGDQSLDFDQLQPPGRIIRLEQRSCASARS